METLDIRLEDENGVFLADLNLTPDEVQCMITYAISEQRDKEKINIVYEQGKLTEADIIGLVKEAILSLLEKEANKYLQSENKGV
jgi:hypothetical protein